MNSLRSTLRNMLTRLSNSTRGTLMLPSPSYSLSCLNPKIQVVIVFEKITHPLQYLVMLYQKLHGYKHANAVHTILYFLHNEKWIRVELGWNGLSIMNEYPEVNEDTLTVIELEDDANAVFNRLSLALSIGLSERFRFSPWQCVPHIMGRPIWFNCTSLVSWLVFGILVDDPAKLREFYDK